MGSTRIVGLLIGLFLLTASSASALDPRGFAFSFGQFDVARDAKPIEIGVEYRLKPIKLWSVPLTFAFGISGTEDDEHFWIYGAGRYDFEVSKRWIITPTLGASYYHQGEGKDLGGPVEFRSGLEFAYRLPGGNRIGLLFYHLSHANIYANNPGANSLVLTWSLGR